VIKSFGGKKHPFVIHIAASPYDDFGIIKKAASKVNAASEDLII